jgi:hypothetical protein
MAFDFAITDVEGNLSKGVLEDGSEEVKIPRSLGLGGASCGGRGGSAPGPAPRPLLRSCKWPTTRPLSDSHDCLQNASRGRPMAAALTLCSHWRRLAVNQSPMAWMK